MTGEMWLIILFTVMFFIFHIDLMMICKAIRDLEDGTP